MKGSSQNMNKKRTRSTFKDGLESNYETDEQRNKTTHKHRKVQEQNVKQEPIPAQNQKQNKQFVDKDVFNFDEHLNNKRPTTGMRLRDRSVSQTRNDTSIKNQKANNTSDEDGPTLMLKNNKLKIESKNEYQSRNTQRNQSAKNYLTDNSVAPYNAYSTRTRNQKQTQQHHDHSVGSRTAQKGGKVTKNNNINDHNSLSDSVSDIDDSPTLDNRKALLSKKQRELSSKTQKSKPKSAKQPISKNSRNHRNNEQIEEEDESLMSSSGRSSEEEDTRNKGFQDEVEMDEYDQACEKLQLNSIPDSFPCRGKERKYIEEYLANGLKNKGCSSSLYISGMPGTGKTATTLEVIKKFKAQKQNNFKFLHINAMSLTNPNLVYTVIHEHITRKRVNPTSAADFLDTFFKKKDKQKLLQQYVNGKKTGGASKRNQKNIVRGSYDPKKEADIVRVVLIDELDALVNKKQTLLYNLFDWPCHQNSRLLIIAIANTMDLPERLQAKIASRIGNSRLVYEPYNKDQIQTILESRLHGIPIFDSSSIKLVASKVSSYSGDIRRSLAVTKRAVELCKLQYLKICQDNLKAKIKHTELMKVTYHHVQSAFMDLYNSKTCQVLRALRNYEVLVILAIYSELIVHKKEKVLLNDVQVRCDNMLKTVNWKHKFMTTNVFREIVKRLHSFGLVAMHIESHKITDNVWLQLYVYYDELKQSFFENELFKIQEANFSIHQGNSTS
eukprot:403352961